MKATDVSDILRCGEGILPDVSPVIAELERNLRKARIAEVKLDYIDLAAGRLREALLRFEQNFTDLENTEGIDDHGPYDSFRTEMRNLVAELSMMRESIRIDAVNNGLPTTKESPETLPDFAPAVQPPTLNAEPQWPAGEVMTVEELAAYTKWSKSWIYKHYKEYGIPYVNDGGLRFRKDSIDEFMRLREKNHSRPAR